MPADGVTKAQDIGPRIPGGEATGLMRAENTQEIYSIDPMSGDYGRLDWSAAILPDWQRRGE